MNSYCTKTTKKNIFPQSTLLSLENTVLSDIMERLSAVIGTLLILANMAGTQAQGNTGVSCPPQWYTMLRSNLGQAAATVTTNSPVCMVRRFISACNPPAPYSGCPQNFQCCASSTMSEISPCFQGNTIPAGHCVPQSLSPYVLSMIQMYMTGMGLSG